MLDILIHKTFFCNFLVVHVLLSVCLCVIECKCKCVPLVKRSKIKNKKNLRIVNTHFYSMLKILCKKRLERI